MLRNSNHPVAPTDDRFSVHLGWTGGSSKTLRKILDPTTGTNSSNVHVNFRSVAHDCAKDYRAAETEEFRDYADDYESFQCLRRSTETIEQFP
jgi:hypothetical protein